MADCGATGTAIDRAASAALGTAGQKHLSALVGHAAIANAGVAMPLATPTHLPQQQQQQMMMPVVSAPSLMTAQQSLADQAWQQSNAQQQNAGGARWMAPQQQLHQQQHMMMHQQQHMMMMQQQQVMQMNAMRMQAQQQVMQQQATNLKQEEATTVENWHEGLEDDVAAHGVSMEELANAWRQAEAEYDIEEAANLGNIYNSSTVEELNVPYEFQYPLSAEAATQKSAADWMQVGLEEFQAGNISQAVQAFETLVQVQDSHAQAWYYLGKCFAEHDLDVKAIACLERSVERDPFAPQALLALGVSYVNELNHKKALQNLKEWITHNPKYAGLDSGVIDSDGAVSELDQVQGLLRKALDFEPTSEVYEALGVVYNVSREYEKAVASFTSALELRPNDYSLYNKLGATLANSNQSDEALQYYQLALQGRPKYARAWLNLAISHSNLQNYQEAARSYLQTLSLNPNATHCWSYLRIAISCTEEWDLLPLVADQDLKGLQQHFDFVLYDGDTAVH